MIRSLRSPIGRRLAISALAVGLLVSSLVTAVQLWLFYRNESEVALQTLDDIGKSRMPGIVDGLWDVDMERVGVLLDGISKVPGVSYVGLVSRDGDRIARGDMQGRVLARRVFPLVHGRDRRVDLGTLEVRYSDAQIIDRIKRRSVLVAVTTFATLGVSLVLLLWLIRYRVTLHLEVMGRYAEGLNTHNLDVPLSLPGKAAGQRPDELDHVVDSLNRMREALRSEIAAQKRTEDELELHRNHLAEIVKARTAALQEKTRELEEQKAAISLLANTDALTGVFSRRHFDELAKFEIVRYWRTGNPLSLLLLDIDHFKQVNDTYGHAGGDAALVALADICRGALRELDVIGRIGGEEFAILLFGDDEAGAMLVAERLRLAVAGTSVKIGNASVHLTVSIGIATLTRPEQGLEELLKIADDALYIAKREGRNRAVAGNGEA